MISLLILTIEEEELRRVVEEICDLYYRNMMKLSLDILNNKQDAEDAVQDAFYNISRHAEVFQKLSDTETAALVSTYTRNAAINIYNRKKRTAQLFVPLDDTGHHTDLFSDEQTLDKLLENEEMAEAVRQAVNCLKAPYRDVIYLKYFYHYKNTEIARVLHTTPNDINVRIFRARQKLRALLQSKL